VLGPEFVAADESAYNRMVELQPESVTAFWQRADELNSTRQPYLLRVFVSVVMAFGRNQNRQSPIENCLTPSFHPA